MDNLITQHKDKVPGGEFIQTELHSVSWRGMSTRWNAYADACCTMYCMWITDSGGRQAV